MSDSDENLVRDVFKVPSDNAINPQTAKFRNNTMFSEYNIPNQYTGFDRCGSYLASRREMSDMSVHRFPMNDQSNFNQSIRSSHSMYNGGRPRPLMYARSMDSNANISAADIALAFKNGDFSNQDLQLIKSAFNSLIKKRWRTRIEKRRRRKIIMRQHKRNSSGESGDNDSDSPLSDDQRSVRSEIIPDIRPNRRSADRNMFTNLIRENGNICDSTDNLKRNTLRNQLNVLSRTTGKCNTTPYDKHQNIEYSYVVSQVSQNVHNHTNTAQNTMHKNQFNEQVQSTNFLKQTERFAKNSVLLPYQRFGGSKENSTIVGKPKSNQQEKFTCNKLCETDSENENIFTQSTNKVNFIQTNGYQHKKVLETNKMTYPEEKKGPYKKSVKNYLKSFWDTDFETDVEETKDRSMHSGDTSRSADVPKCTRSAVRENLKDKMSDKHHENNENDMDISTPSQSKKQESLMLTKDDNLNKPQLNSKAKYQNGKEEVKLNTPPSVNKENSTLNISRESLPLKQKMEEKKDINTSNANNESSLNKTKESRRINQKKKEKLITTSRNKENSTSNITRESQRLKLKKEAKESSTKSLSR